jgi:ElaB/YqjD/DUF883 family membrane-anchored ribosome-binding protein
MDPLITYFQAHPLIALGLALLVGLLCGSILRKLMRLAFWLGLVLLIGLYFTHRAAQEDWRTRAEILREHGAELLKKAGEQVKKYGEDALEGGKRVIEKELSEE